MKKSHGDVILAIESAIGGGSISLIRNRSEISSRIGSSSFSKAEDLLADIVILMESSGVGRQEIGLIAVSAGPGSFTGIRIGIATALGLRAGLDVPMSSVSALKAIAHSQRDGEKITVGLSVGRDAVCLQSFKKRTGKLAELEEPHTLSEPAFLSFATNAVDAQLVVHTPLYEKLGPSSAVDFGNNIAFAIGNACSETSGKISQPLFISKSL